MFRFTGVQRSLARSTSSEIQKRAYVCPCSSVRFRWWWDEVRRREGLIIIPAARALSRWWGHECPEERCGEGFKYKSRLLASSPTTSISRYTQYYTWQLTCSTGKYRNRTGRDLISYPSIATMMYTKTLCYPRLIQHCLLLVHTRIH